MSKLPHSTQNNRLSKALMIEKFISKKSKTKTLKLLEIGTGTGLIASYFANQSNYKYEVHSLDVVDNCISKININFQMIKDTQLPFPDMEFDFIISNHVIELIYAELSGDFPLGDSRQPTYKSLRPFDLVS